MPNGTYGGVRGRKTKVGRKLLRFPPTRLKVQLKYYIFRVIERYILMFSCARIRRIVHLFDIIELVICLGLANW